MEFQVSGNTPGMRIAGFTTEECQLLIVGYSSPVVVFRFSMSWYIIQIIGDLGLEVR